MDGGGSVTAVLAQDDGFTTVNSPCDGAPRSIFSALLMVERRKPDVDIEVVDYDDKSATFKLNIALHGYTCKKVKFELSGTFYDVTEENGEYYVHVGKLRRGKPYDCDIIITTDSDEKVKVTAKAKLPPLKPSIGTCAVMIDGSNKVYLIELTDKDSTLKSYYLLVDGVKYELQDDTTIRVPLDSGVPYLKIVYDIGNGEEILTIKYPESTALRTLDDGFLLFNDFLKGMQ